MGGKQLGYFRGLFWLSLLTIGGLGAVPARAGVFNIPRFLPVDQSAIGVEPELTLTNGAGVAINARYARGITDLNNAYAILGTGGGPRRFRVGGGFTFDFFPDVPGQPGIGVGAQALYVRLPDQGQLELTGIPYIHKVFSTEGNEVDPFVSIPLGMAFHNGRYDALASLVVGGSFKASEKMDYILELGIAINHTETYLSGGVVFRP